MLLSKDQVRRFFREWKTACENQGWTSQNGWTSAQIENERHQLLDRAGFSSLTDVDRVTGFTAVLKELAILREDLSAMVRAESNPRRVLINSVASYARTLAVNPRDDSYDSYIRHISVDRFGTFLWRELTDDQLTQLRNTLADRCVQQHKFATQRRRSDQARHRRQSATNQPDSRVHFHQSDLVAPVHAQNQAARTPDLSDPSEKSETMITCSKCGTVYPSTHFCDECEIRRMNARANEAHVASDDDDNTPF